jgi:DNA-binding transcriptional LysR family regulator
VRSLRYFRAVGEELHFGRAAARLHISQPSLSRAVRELETSLGVELLVRTKRSVRLTAAGRALLEDAPAAIDAVERCFTRAQRAGRGELGDLAVGFLPSVTALLLPMAVTAFRSAYSGVRLELREMLDDPLLGALEAGALDVAILRSRREQPGLRFEPLFDDPIHVALPLGHGLADRERLSFADLREELFVLWPRSQSREGYDQVVAGCRAAGFEPRIIQECALPNTTLGLVAAGVGVSVLSSLFKQFRHDVAFVPLEQPCGAIYLAWRSSEASGARDCFVDLIRTARRSLGAAPAGPSAGARTPVGVAAPANAPA